MKYIYLLLAVFLLFLLGLLILLDKGTLNEYEESSQISKMLHEEAVQIANNLKCDNGKFEIQDFELLKARYPKKVIALKDKDLLIDGFQFTCTRDQGFYRMKEIKPEQVSPR